ncbi:F-box protein [Cardamine amara subsp. amara]|uniref:F-box protein n=1 Tax=Cardamine amara subsp. amara TaxID=228776 RepID=A0ABD0ZD47_CARAN
MGDPNPLMRVSQISLKTGRRRTIPEPILVEILARLPLRSIARFKSLCKRLKAIIESTKFRRLFISMHQNSSSSWSLMFRTIDHGHGRSYSISNGAAAPDRWTSKDRVINTS